MRDKRYMFFKIIIIFILFIFMQKSYSIGCSEENNILSNISTVSDISSAIVSFANLVFIIAFYINDQKSSERQKKIEYTFYWYRNYVIKDAISIIEEHVNECIKIIEDCKNDNGQANKQYIINMIEKFTYSNNYTKDRIASLLNVVNLEISSNILEEFRRIQDMFTNEIVNITTDLNQLENNIKAERTQLLNSLYKFGLNEII